jgi:hypothetical protein
VLVELLNSRLEVGGGLVLDETLATRAGGVALAVDLTVDNVKARLAREVLEILVSKSAYASVVESEQDRIPTRTCQLVSNGRPVMVIR